MLAAAQCLLASVKWGPETHSLPLPVSLRPLETGSSVGTQMGHRGPPGLGQYYSSGTVGYFLFAMALQTALTGSGMLWTQSEWDNDDYILFCLFFFQFSFHIDVSRKKGKPCQFLVP